MVKCDSVKRSDCFCSNASATMSRKMSPSRVPFWTSAVRRRLIIPNMVLALRFFFAFSQLRLVGTWWIGLVLAHSILALPFVFITVDAALREVDPALKGPLSSVFEDSSAASETIDTDRIAVCIHRLVRRNSDRIISHKFFCANAAQDDLGEHHHVHRSYYFRYR